MNSCIIHYIVYAIFKSFDVAFGLMYAISVLNFLVFQFTYCPACFSKILS